jgi:hypothetical protein
MDTYEITTKAKPTMVKVAARRPRKPAVKRNCNKPA